jgi:hypothetical protein
MTGKQKTQPPKNQAPKPNHIPAPANEVIGAESPTAVTTTPDLLSGLPNHPTTRTLRQATTLQLQHEYGNAQVQRLLLSAPVSTVQGNVIQRAITFDEAKKRIRKAGKGWGTDEGGIYAAIRECSDRGRLKNDPDVQYILKDEMSGHDLWKAYFLLEYGNEAAFPPAVQEVWAATKGAGTDENRIYRALQRLSVADATRLNALPGFQDLLRSELSGKDLNAVRQLLSGDYARAIALHKANVLFVKNELARMKLPANPPLVRNTAEWLEPTTPGATPKNDLYVLTPTHDSAARGKEHGKDPDVAYFGDSPQYPDDTATYEAHIESERNIHYSAASVGGEHLGRKIWVHNPTIGGMSFQEVMVHEVQHDADRHDLED